MNTEQGSDAGNEPIMTEPFDQTNGVAGGLEGDSDGTAASDTGSETDRADDGGDIRHTEHDAGQGAMGAGYIVGRQE